MTGEQEGLIVSNPELDRKVVTQAEAARAERQGKRWDPVAVSYVEAEGTVTVRVREGTQIVHRGEVHEGGATLQASPAEARSWILNGWAAIEPPSRKR